MREERRNRNKAFLQKKNYSYRIFRESGGDSEFLLQTTVYIVKPEHLKLIGDMSTVDSDNRCPSCLIALERTVQAIVQTPPRRQREKA